MKSFPDLQYDTVGGSSKKIWVNVAGWLPSGITLSSVAFSIPNQTGLTFANTGVTADLGYTTVTATQAGKYEINIKLTLSDSNIEYRSADMRVLKRKSL